MFPATGCEFFILVDCVLQNSCLRSRKYNLPFIFTNQTGFVFLFYSYYFLTLLVNNRLAAQ